MELSVTRRLEFDAGHRVWKHESKCANPHGHRYVVEITAIGEIDDIGRIIDFSVLKEKIGKWIDVNWDHTFLINREDEELIKCFKWITHNKRPFICDWNPTAENMATYLLFDVCPTQLQGTGVTVTKVVVHETPNCKAEASLSKATLYRKERKLNE
jgi:6-pyruvoyltetrahydropterin/6-carboxytetrahydropterin synthase